MPALTNTHPSRRARLGRTGVATVAVVGLLLGPAATAEAAPSNSGETYEVRRGDTLTSVARRFGTTVGALVAENGLASRHRIVAGRTLRIPAGSPAGGAPAAAAASSSSPQRPGQRHQVRRGETLQGIAARYGIRGDDLAAWNGIVGGRVYADTRLILFDPGGLPSASGGSGTHVVVRGDTLWGIARRNGTTVGALASGNGIGNPNRIRVGTRLRVPGGSAIRCPVPGARYTNDWGYPRSGGRGHAGNDLFAPAGTPVLAPVDGVVRTTTGRVGGRQLWLTDAAGNTWFGSHLDAFGATGSVRAGEVIGRVGTSGNAAGTSPHLHLEYRPAGGEPVNPYPLLREIC